MPAGLLFANIYQYNSGMSYILPVQLKPSYYMLIFAIVIHAGAAFILFMLPLELLWRVLGGIFLSASLIHSVGWHALKIVPMAIKTIWQVSPYEWMWMERRGKRVKGRLMGDSVVITGLIILNFRVSWYQYRTVILCGDMLSLEEWRRLRMYFFSIQTQ